MARHRPRHQSSRLAKWVRILNHNQGVIALIALLLLVIQLTVQSLQGTATPLAPVPTTIKQNVTIIEQGGTAESTFRCRQPHPLGGVWPFKSCHGRYPGVGSAVDPPPSGWV
jgi:hypothetical protein